MKKLFMLLAVAGIFASCSKETPIAPATPKVQDQEAPVQLTGEEAGEEGIRLSLRLDVEDFEEVAGGFDATQQARAVIPGINTGAANKKLINLRAYVDGGTWNADRLNGMIYLYNKTKNETIPFNAPFRVYNDGKSIGYDGLVSGFAKGSKYREFFDRMVDQRMANCYVSVIIGNDVGNLNFTNKGPHVITSWGDDVKLPKNFVMLKSEHNPVGWRNDKKGKVHEISTAGDVRMKLKMMGYLMMARVHNTFPQYVMRINPATQAPYTDASGKNGYRAPRPAMFTYLDVSPTLSAAQYQQLVFTTQNNGKFSMQSGSRNTRDFNNRGSYLEYKTILQVPVSTAPAGELPAKGDYVVAMYFPQVDDYGSVGIRRVVPDFYDGSPYSLAPGIGYQTLGTLVDKFQKSKPAVGSTTQYQKGLDNKVYYPVFKVGPKTMNRTSPAKDPILSRYRNWTTGAQWEAIP